MQREQKWWDKWFNNNHEKRWNLRYETNLIDIVKHNGTNDILNQIFEGERKRVSHQVELELKRDKGTLIIREDAVVGDDPRFSVTRLVFKLLCEYYKNQE